MILNHTAVASLSAALKQRRQLTFGEQAMAQELLQTLSRAALAHFGATHPNTEPEEHDTTDVRKLKRRKLLEVGMLIEDPAADLDDAQRDLIHSLLREAITDFNQAGHHHSAVNLPNAPAPKATPKATNVEDPRVGMLLALCNALKERADACDATCELLQQRLGHVEGVVDILNAPSAHSSDVADSDKKG